MISADDKKWITSEFKKHTDSVKEDLGKKVGDGFEMISELGEGWTNALNETNRKVKEIDGRLKIVEAAVLRKGLYIAGAVIFLAVLIIGIIK